ncbi:Trehalose/maltose import ATP-binding protein MalK [uncultured archaeon]|nr:Trehalose/maltose import ATP-binding protein MalK [uncultured archaeon]
MPFPRFCGYNKSITGGEDLSEKLLEIRKLKKYYPVQTGFLSRHSDIIKAVDCISLDINEGETVGLVGESGCGKTTLGKVIIRLEEPAEGEVLFKGMNILSLKGGEMKKYRREVQMIFQDPSASLDPRMTVGNSIGEALLIHGMEDERKRMKRVEELLNEVGLEAGDYSRYPHEFSGGQKQRIGIARALALRPKLIIADEPVSALDISVQAQILNLLTELKEEYKMSYLFIAHNMAVIRYLCDRVAVMKAGKIVEEGEVEEIFEKPKHPYTKALLEAAPVLNPHVRRL